MKFIKENEKSIMVVVGTGFIFCAGYVSGGVVLASNLYKDLIQEEIHKGMTPVRESSEKHTVPAKTYASGAFDMVFWEKAHKANFDAIKFRFKRFQESQQVLFEEHLKKQETGSIFAKPVMEN